jgi:GxxExxY protein
MDDERLFKNEVYQLVGAGMEVYNELNTGYHEPVYQEAYEKELGSRSIPFTSRIQKSYQPDVAAFGRIIAELKVLDRLTSREESQVINYLKASGLQVGLLLNFASER